MHLENQSNYNLSERAKGKKPAPVWLSTVITIVQEQFEQKHERAFLSLTKID